jgi:hypothetical protein
MSVIKIIARLIPWRKPSCVKKNPQVMDTLYLTGRQWLNIPIHK